jgi:carbonic anhydrase
MKKLKFLAAPMFVAALLISAGPATAATPGGVTPDEALAKLMDGNAKFKQGDMNNLLANSTQAVRQALAAGQHPYAIVLDCSDSRVSPEIIFDKGLGEIFVIRVAGNVVAPHQIGSIEYAIEHLGASLVMVLGHSHCGAVKATVESLAAGSCSVPPAKGNIGSLIDSIAPAVEKACMTNPADLLAASVDMNVEEVARRLEKKSAIVEEAILTGKIKLVKARYDLEDGVVKLFP